MNNDSETTANSKTQPDEESQNRRQFFNGLGKWSLAIVAAVAGLREGVYDVRDGIVLRFGTGSDAAGDPRQQIARHGNVPHSNEPPYYFKTHADHANHGNGPFQDGRNSPA